MASLTKKYQTMNDKLRTTGYGKGGVDEHEPKETESGAELIPRNFHTMDNILGNREAVNPKHMLESSSQVDNSPQIDQDLLEKEALDEEMWAIAGAQKEEGYAWHVSCWWLWRRGRRYGFVKITVL